MLNNQIGTMINYRVPHLNPVCFCCCYKHMMSEGCALANLIISSYAIVEQHLGTMSPPKKTAMRILIYTTVVDLSNCICNSTL
jgi:hypothetical protein